MVLSFPGPDRSIRLSDLQAGKAVSRRYRNRRIGEFLKELDLTEGRSTGVPKILRVMKANGSPKPKFESDDERSYFLIKLPIHAGFTVKSKAEEQVTEQVTEQVERLMIALAEQPLNTKALLSTLKIKHRPTFLQNYLQPALQQSLVEMTEPDSPRSPTQKYQLSTKGKLVLEGKR
ncbi:Fic family protein [Catenovulum sediminis]|uniref:Fic family protein n=1 Tax=Catenovulum sediminis TaxID=1740262 RepID=A0ABV1RLI3_9ALTE